MKEFVAVFRMSKTKLFFVNYYTVGSNKNPYFSTSAAEFYRSKSDYMMCGQCQDDVLKDYPTAKSFYKKWDNKHLKQLTDAEWDEMYLDLERLKAKYRYMEKDNDEQSENYSSYLSFGFHTLAEWSN